MSKFKIDKLKFKWKLFWAYERMSGPVECGMAYTSSHLGYMQEVYDLETIGIEKKYITKRTVTIQ